MSDFFKGLNNIVENISNNEMFNYLKFAIYGTDNKEEVEKQEKALNMMLMGIESMNKKNYEKAKSSIKKSIDMYSESKDKLRKAFSQFFMAQVYEATENLQKAIDYYQEAYEIFNEKRNMMALNVEKKIKTLMEEKETKGK